MLNALAPLLEGLFSITIESGGMVRLTFASEGEAEVRALLEGVEEILVGRKVTRPEPRR